MTESKVSDTDPDGIDAEDEHVDGCVEDCDLEEEVATRDFELPPARGGVDQPISPQS